MRRGVYMLFILVASGCSDSGTEIPSVQPPAPGAPAVIAGVYPDSAAAGDTVLISGSRFGTATDSSVVTIGGLASGTIVSWTSTRILAAVPAGAATGTVVVTIGGQASNAFAFRVLPVAEPRVSYSGDLVPLFIANGCDGCHGGTNNLFVTPYASLMAGTSNHGPVVTPYNGEGSVIVKNLRGTAGFGNRMPQGGSPLSEDDIQLVARWIKQGAKNN